MTPTVIKRLRSEDAITAFCASITRGERLVLDPKTEHALIDLSNKGDRTATLVLLMAHEGIVRKMSSRFKRRQDYEDFLQDARAALICAIKAYKDTGARLMTLASIYVESAVGRRAKAQQNIVHVPRDIQWSERMSIVEEPLDGEWMTRASKSPNEDELIAAIDLRAEIRRTAARRALVISMVIDGYTNAEIGAQLNISHQRVDQILRAGWWPLVRHVRATVMAAAQEKVCAKCRCSKPLSMYNSNGRGRGLSPYCVACKSAAQRQRRLLRGTGGTGSGASERL